MYFHLTFLFMTIIVTATKESLKIQADGLVVPDGLYAYYRLDGNASDYSRNNRHGTIYNVVFDTDNVSESTIVGIFNGINSFIDTGIHTTFDEVTVLAWVRPVSKGDYSSIVSNGGSGGGCEEIHLNTYDGDFVASKWHPGNVCGSVGEQIAMEDVWYHVSAIFTVSGVTLFINGINRGYADDSENHVIKDNQYNWNIGTSRQGVGNFFEGFVGEVRIYDRSLSDDEIMHIYKDSILSNFTDVRNAANTSSEPTKTSTAIPTVQEVLLVFNITIELGNILENQNTQEILDLISYTTSQVLNISDAFIISIQEEIPEAAISFGFISQRLRGVSLNQNSNIRIILIIEYPVEQVSMEDVIGTYDSMVSIIQNTTDDGSFIQLLFTNSIFTNITFPSNITLGIIQIGEESIAVFVDDDDDAADDAADDEQDDEDDYIEYIEYFNDDADDKDYTSNIKFVFYIMIAGMSSFISLLFIGLLIYYFLQPSPRLKTILVTSIQVHEKNDEVDNSMDLQPQSSITIKPQ